DLAAGLERTICETLGIGKLAVQNRPHSVGASQTPHETGDLISLGKLSVISQGCFECCMIADFKKTGESPQFGCQNVAWVPDLLGRSQQFVECSSPLGKARCGHGRTDGRGMLAEQSVGKS